MTMAHGLHTLSTSFKNEFWVERSDIYEIHVGGVLLVEIFLKIRRRPQKGESYV